MHVQDVLASLETTNATPVVSISPTPISVSDTAITPTLSPAEEECLQGIYIITLLASN